MLPRRLCPAAAALDCNGGGNLVGVAGEAGLRHLVAAILPFTRKSEPFQSRQAGAIFQSGWTANRTDEQQTVQG